MEILFLVENANLHGGTEILTLNLLHALREVGEDVWVLSLAPYEGADRHVLSLGNKEYDRWQAEANSIRNKLSFSVKSDRILGEILREKYNVFKPALLVNQTYDIITALPTDLPVAQVFNWSVKGYEVSLLSIIRKKGLVPRVISSFCEWGKRIRRHRMLSRVSNLVVLTEAAKDELRSLNKRVRNEQMIVIPDPLTMSKDSVSYSSLRNGNVTFVGRLSYEKGVMRLLRIWEQIYRKMPNLTLSIYGEGDARGDMDVYIKNRNLKNVVFCGFCENLERIYVQSDLLLMTSDTEGFGMVLIEAMYYGVPCVSFDCPISPKEIISDAGVAVPCFDEAAYAEAVVNLLQDPERMRSLQQKSIERARDFYIDKVVGDWINLIDRSN